jgi:hypothetical protein
MKIFKELNKLGYKHYTEHTVEELDKLPLESKERIMEQSLVLRFFREKYNLISSVASIYKDETRTDFEFWYYIQGYEDEELFYETYEEAELDCIKKLIEIVKTKQIGL